MNEALLFSMNEKINGCEWSVKQYVDNKLETARNPISAKDRQRRMDGLGALYNFLGLRSICRLYSSDFIDQYDYHGFIDEAEELLKNVKNAEKSKTCSSDCTKNIMVSVAEKQNAVDDRKKVVKNGR